MKPKKSRLLCSSRTKSIGNGVSRMTKSLAYIGVLVLVVGVLLTTCVGSAWSMSLLDEREMSSIRGRTCLTGSCAETDSYPDCWHDPLDDKCPSIPGCNTGFAWSNPDHAYKAYLEEGEQSVQLDSVMTCHFRHCKFTFDYIPFACEPADTVYHDSDPENLDCSEM